MTNSIRTKITKEDIISDIKMSMSADYLDKKVFLLVEGSSDILFLKKFLNENVDILESFSGKQGVREIIEYFLDDNLDNKVFGICDRDYDYTYQNKHIFYYDYSTLEIMIIHNDHVFKNITMEYYHGYKSFEELRIYILKELSWLSAFRKYSFDKNLNINFTGLSIVEVLEDGVFINEKALEKLNRINNKDLSIYNEFLQVATDDITNLYNITQGHDFIKAFQKLCQDKNSKTPNVNTMESIFRCSFRIEDLTQTQLYKEMNEREINIFTQ